jgi:chromosome segregation ATPase
LEALTTGVAPNYGANKKLNLIAQHSQRGHWQWVEPRSAPSRANSFLQVKAMEAAPERVLKLLSTAASRLQSDVLSAAVMKITLSADHFVKVRGLIKDLIQRLEDNAAAEQTHKAFCDDAIQKATDSRDEANSVIEAKVGALSVADSEIKQLQTEIQDLEAAIAANLKALNEATELRNGEKAENEKTIDESTAGKEAVEYAITVLKEFYEEGGGAELLQSKYTPPNSDRSGKTVGDMAPETFSGEYHGAKSNADGIIGLLDVILSDFERTLTATEDQEEKDQTAYEAMEKDTKEDNDAKKKEIEEKEGQLTDKQDEVITLTEDKKNGLDQLANAKDELSKLKPMCLEGEETYAQRVEKREKEIEALKEPMTILDDWQK